jgi:hypothetical protein
MRGRLGGGEPHGPVNWSTRSPRFCEVQVKPLAIAFSYPQDEMTLQHSFVADCRLD